MMEGWVNIFFFLFFWKGKTIRFAYLIKVNFVNIWEYNSYRWSQNKHLQYDELRFKIVHHRKETQSFVEVSMMAISVVLSLVCMQTCSPHLQRARLKDKLKWQMTSSNNYAKSMWTSCSLGILLLWNTITKFVMFFILVFI